MGKNECARHYKSGFSLFLFCKFLAINLKLLSINCKIIMKIYTNDGPQATVFNIGLY